MLQSCCWMRLHTGVKVLGWIGIVGGILFVIRLMYQMNNVWALAHLCKANCNYFLDDADGRILLFEHSVMIICSILLLVGISKNRPGFLLPWLILHLPIGTLHLIHIFVKIPNDQFKDPSYFSVIVWVVVDIYFFYAIFSLYKLMKDTEDIKNGRAGTGGA